MIRPTTRAPVDALEARHVYIGQAVALVWVRQTGGCHLGGGRGLLARLLRGALRRHRGAGDGRRVRYLLRLALGGLVGGHARQRIHAGGCISGGSGSRWNALHRGSLGRLGRLSRLGRLRLHHQRVGGERIDQPRIATGLGRPDQPGSGGGRARSARTHRHAQIAQDDALLEQLLGGRITVSSTLPNWLKYAFTSSADVSWLTPPTKIFFVLFDCVLGRFFGVACFGSIFLPSSVCIGTCSTLSTLFGSWNVMNPKPRLRCVGDGGGG
uniref:Uncharacterized protein n=1 Tax=Anopheles coluzzii TaxID=1518534 RepID=A0A8W7P0A0_ANOCL